MCGVQNAKDGTLNGYHIESKPALSVGASAQGMKSIYCAMDDTSEWMRITLHQQEPSSASTNDNDNRKMCVDALALFDAIPILGRCDG